MTKFKYFFGSDKRSVPYLEVLINNFDNLKVVTVEPKQTGRGRTDYMDGGLADLVDIYD